MDSRSRLSGRWNACSMPFALSWLIGEAVCHGCELECTSSSVLQIGRSGVPQRPGCRAGMVYGRSALLAAPRTVMGRLCNLLHLTSINFW